MNVELLLREFDRLSEAPDAVSRCRQAILDLAAQGRLVRQLPVDDPVDDSLRAISNSADSNGYESLPAGWVPSRMSLATTLITSGSRGWAQYYAKTGAMFVRSQNVKSGALDLRDLARVSLTEAAEGKRTKLERGDLLIVITGDVGHVGAWETDRGDAYISQHIALARPVRTEFTPWLLLWLRAPGGGNGQLRAGIYGGKPGLNLQQVGGISLPLPPLQEQRRIVAKVDELMAVCDELETAQEQRERRRKQLSAASLARLTATGDTPGWAAEKNVAFFLSHSSRIVTRPSHVAEVRRGLCELAVRGSLGTQSAEDSSSATLVGEALTRLAPRQRNVVRDLEEFPFSIPTSWTWSRLGAFVLSSDAGWSPSCETFPREGTSWGVLKVSAVSWGEFRPEENKQLIRGLDPRLAARVKNGDFLVSRANTAELVAKAVIVDTCPVNLMLSDKIVRLRFVDSCDQRYFLLVNNRTTYAREYYAEAASGASPSMKNVSREAIYGLPIPIPPLEEQHRIVAKVDELMAVCNELERSLAAAQSWRARALEAVLHQVLEEAGAPLPELLEVAG